MSLAKDHVQAAANAIARAMMTSVGAMRAEDDETLAKNVKAIWTQLETAKLMLDVATLCLKDHPGEKDGP